MTLSIKSGRYAFLLTLDLMLSAIIKRVLIVTNFERPSYQTFD